MIILRQQLIDQTADSTLSALYTPDREFLGFVIEDGARPKKIKGRTRIPGGTYRLRKRTWGRFYDRYRSVFGHGWVPELEDVPLFADILIHIGNTIEDTRGCLLINSGCIFNFEQRVWEGRNSRAAYLNLYDYLDELIDKYEVFIEIKR